MPNLVLVPQSEVLTPIFQVSCPTTMELSTSVSTLSRGLRHLLLLFVSLAAATFRAKTACQSCICYNLQPTETFSENRWGWFSRAFRHTAVKADRATERQHSSFDRKTFEHWHMEYANNEWYEENCPGPKTIKKNTNSTPNKSQTQSARA